MINSEKMLFLKNKKCINSKIKNKNKVKKKKIKD